MYISIMKMNKCFLSQLLIHVKLKELTGNHSPVTGSGRSLPPLGAIHIICDPPLLSNISS